MIQFHLETRTHMQDLKDVTRDLHYENYRLRRIKDETDHPEVKQERLWVDDLSVHFLIHVLDHLFAKNIL